jgi:hypothetical protein
MLLDFKKSKLYIGITLVIQAISFIALFIMMYSKKSKYASAFLTLGLIEGAIGAYLLYMQKLEDDIDYEDDFGDFLKRDYGVDENFDDADFDTVDEPDDDNNEIVIPIDESVDETEFN